MLSYLFAHPEIIVEPLPKYAPELNPEEYCHGPDTTHLANATAKHPPEMCHLIDHGSDHLRRKAQRLLGFLCAAGLPVTQFIRPC